MRSAKSRALPGSTPLAPGEHRSSPESFKRIRLYLGRSSDFGPAPSRAAAAGRLSEQDAGSLIELHARLMTVILTQQLRDLDAGVRPSSRVSVRGLARGEARMIAELRRLEQVLRALQELMAR